MTFNEFTGGVITVMAVLSAVFVVLYVAFHRD